MHLSLIPPPRRSERRELLLAAALLAVFAAGVATGWLLRSGREAVRAELAEVRR